MIEGEQVIQVDGEVGPSEDTEAEVDDAWWTACGRSRQAGSRPPESGLSEPWRRHVLVEVEDPPRQADREVDGDLVGILHLEAMVADQLGEVAAVDAPRRHDAPGSTGTHGCRR